MEKLAKKARSTKEIYTFTMNTSPAQVQLLSDHTLDDLVHTCFKECNPVPGENADDHLWFVTIDGEEYESGEIECRSELRANQTCLMDVSLMRNKQIDLEYDQTRHSIVVNSVEPLPDDANVTDFPRKKPIPVSTMAAFTTDLVDLNTVFRDFNEKWCSAHSRRPEINLFQVGRRNNHGYLEKSGCRMIFMPTKAESLVHYLHSLNHAAAVESGMYGWHSVVVLPKDVAKTSKYKEDLEPGFCDCEFVPPSAAPKLALDTIFPNVCSLGGFGKLKKGTKRGWIRYRDNVLMICSGSGSPNSCPQAPAGTAFEGKGCHTPLGDNEVLARKSIQISSLQELFCTVEGMLMSL